MKRKERKRKRRKEKRKAKNKYRKIKRGRLQTVKDATYIIFCSRCRSFGVDGGGRGERGEQP
jgi:hypothetical protein